MTFEEFFEIEPYTALGSLDPLEDLSNAVAKTLTEKRINAEYARGTVFENIVATSMLHSQYHYDSIEELIQDLINHPWIREAAENKIYPTDLHRVVRKYYEDLRDCHILSVLINGQEEEVC